MHAYVINIMVVLIIFPVILQTVINVIMLSIRGQGKDKHCKCPNSTRKADRKDSESFPNGSSARHTKCYKLPRRTVTLSTSDNLLRRRRDQITRIISGLLQPTTAHSQFIPISVLHNSSKVHMERHK